MAYVLNRNINEENRQDRLKKTLYVLSSMLGIEGALYFSKLADDLACIGWQCAGVIS